MCVIYWIRYAVVWILLSKSVDGYTLNDDITERDVLRYIRDIRDNEVPDEDEFSIRMTEVCTHDGNQMKCGEDETLRLGNIVCGGGSHACPMGTNRTIFAVCQGQRTCATLGLRDMLDSYCGSPVDIARQIHVTFRCVKSVPSRSPCKSNICEKENKGLQCHDGGVIHILKARCLDGVSACSWPTFVSLYTLCEGQDSCAASGLRMMMPSYCNHRMRSMRSVLVDYICLPRGKIKNKCTGGINELDSKFGVMMNPGYTSGSSSGSDSEQCYWLIKHLPGTTIKVTVHLAYRKEGMPNCNTQFLQVRYSDCQTLASRINSYCDLKKVNQILSSCGDVYITSFLPPSIEDLSDRFLVSYNVMNNTAKDIGLEVHDVTRCSADIPVLPSIASSTSGTQVSGRNIDPKGSLYEFSEGHSNRDEVTDDESHSSSPSGFILRFKLVILYVFFGVVILALIIALVFVIVSYRGIAQKGQYKVESSEKMALWKNEDGNQSATAQHNSIAENPSEVNTPGSQTDETRRTIATVHNMLPSDCENRPRRTGSEQNLAVNDTAANRRSASGYHTLPNLSSENRRSGASGKFSSFRDTDDYYDSINPYASFTSINSDDIPARSNRATNEKTKKGEKESPEEQPLVLQNGTPAIPNGVDHYTVNDDDYAIIRKAKKPANIQETNVDDIEPTYDNLFEEDLVGFKPTSGPYDKNRDSGMDFNIRFSSINGWNDDL